MSCEHNLCFYLYFVAQLPPTVSANGCTPEKEDTGAGERGRCALSLIFTPHDLDGWRTPNGILSRGTAAAAQNMTFIPVEIGVVVDYEFEKWVGEMWLSCINMSLSDHYAKDSHYKTRLVLHVRDSKDNVLGAVFSLGMPTFNGFSFNSLGLVERCGSARNPRANNINAELMLS